MADVIRKATNKFTKGLVMDFSPENTRNEVLTQALNATLLTFNGNELSLQNDMGNARVETAYLPEGYIPVGTCEYGGVIYIVSYNPLEDKSQIGCFPSPERNVSRHELGESENATITNDKFQGAGGQIKNTTQYVLLKNDKLNPGDKFLICANEQIYDEKLENLLVRESSVGKSTNFDFVNNPILALNIVSIEDSGKIVYLNNDVRTYTNTHSYVDENGNSYTNEYKYPIVGSGNVVENKLDQEFLDPDAYRDVLSSGYSVFKSKTSGKLAILAELIMIDSYNVTHSLIPKKNDYGQIVEGAFDIVIHTEITPEVTGTNYNTVPKLQYYYLQQSQGLLSKFDEPSEEQPKEKQISLYKYVENSGVYSINRDFTKIKMDEIYEKTVSDEYFNGVIDRSTIYDVGKFNFPIPETYHGRMEEYKGDLNEASNNSIYTKFTEGKYHRIKGHQVYKDANSFNYYVNTLRASFYKYVETKDEYTKWTESTLNDVYTYYTQVTKYEYENVKRDEAFKGNNRTLYKLTSVLRKAKDEEIKNKEIEKFTYTQILTIRPATSEELSNNTPLFEKDGDNYIEITGKPESGKIYYVWSEEMGLVSIGYEIDSEQLYNGIYIYPRIQSYVVASQEDITTYWDFETYPLKANEGPSYGCPVILFYQIEKPEYKPATAEELVNYKPGISILYYQPNYKYIYPEQVKLASNDDLFIVVPIDAYVPYNKFQPNPEYNYIKGYDKPAGDYPKDDPISLHKVSDFIPRKLENGSVLSYDDLILANIQIPLVVTTNGLDLPFKYDYTIVPCMNYGRLDHLAVSNTVDFSKLHAFDQSNFNTWKYHIDGEQLRLTFGAEIYDTYEEHKVSGLLLEFYDLWGFAGSLEINNKKAYNGLFTKVLPLNTRNILSKNKHVGGGALKDTFKRNINITYNKDNDEFEFNKTKVVFDNEHDGWYGINDEDNDCGTLYSNILYTVKTYLRREGDKGIEYLPKREFFLYTLPIFNEYYYNITDFSAIDSPPLDLVLTYKLQDSSSQQVYSQDGDSDKNTIVKGYYKQDEALLNQYTSGYIGNNVQNINTIKYINYVGQTNLYLEIGLKQDYQDFGLKYSPDINSRFSCTIELVGNDNKRIYDVISNNKDNKAASPELLLNYYRDDNTPISIDVNKLGFGSDQSSSLSLTNLQDYNFLYSGNSTHIPINYNFVVGYPLNVTNIRETEIQALTICALCHQDDNGEYNYSDFGIYEQGNRYLSETMWYNGGNHTTERFGVCKMVDPDAQFMGNQCQSIDFVETEATYIKNAGKLNTGEPLKRMREYIGKLTFCQPHAHCLIDTEGVNIHGDDSSPRHAIAPKYAVGRGVTQGLLPWWYLYQNPRYNSCLHTKNTINSYSEFISTLQHSEFSSTKVFDKEWKKNDDAFLSGNTKAKEYTGLTASDLEKYNSRLLQTMKKVYAYNPDYDTLKMYAGDVSAVDNQINFTSHLVSKDAKINFNQNESLNDFIYFGGIKVSDYIDYMWQHSAKEEKDRINIYSDIANKIPQKQITFIEGLSYCGGDDPYLISSLTYNTPLPEDLYSEWALKVSNPVVVRKENREYVIINGAPNKKTLYGFDDESQKLVELDVSNYTISTDGSLHLNNVINVDTLVGSVQTLPETIIPDNTYEVKLDCKENLTANMSIEGSIYLKSDKNTSYFMWDHTSNTNNLVLTVKIQIPEINDISYKVNSITVTGSAFGRMLDPALFSSDGREITGYNKKLGLRDQEVSNLESLLLDDHKDITLKFEGSNNYNISNRNCWVDPASGEHFVLVNDIRASFDTSDSGEYKLQLNPTLEKGIGLYKISIDKISFNLVKEQSLSTVESNIVSGIRTVKYAEKINHVYTVKSDYDESRIRGTSLTINDLEYDYKGDHRLFIKSSNLISYDSYLRNKLYYRDTNGHSNTEQYEYGEEEDAVVENGCLVIRASGDAHLGKNNPDFEYLNTLYFYTGPCFTKDNL